MPFKNKSQKKACYAKMKEYNDIGLVSPWDCKKFEKHSPKKIHNGNRVHIGPRGGKFVIVNNKKYYI